MKIFENTKNFGIPEPLYLWNRFQGTILAKSGSFTLHAIPEIHTFLLITSLRQLVKKSIFESNLNFWVI